MLTVLILHNIESVYFFYSNPVYCRSLLLWGLWMPEFSHLHYRPLTLSHWRVVITSVQVTCAALCKRNILEYSVGQWILCAFLKTV